MTDDGRPVTDEGRSTVRRSSVVGRRFRQAGVVYLLVGIVVPLFMLTAGLMPPSRVPWLFLLLPGVAFVVVFGAIILFAPSLWRWRWTVAPTVWLARLLALTNTGRTVVFLLNAGGIGLQVFPPSGQILAAARHEPEPLYLFNASLTSLAVVMLARAGWARSEE